MTTCTLSQVWEERPCPLGQQLTDDGAHLSLNCLLSQGKRQARACKFGNSDGGIWIIRWSLNSQYYREDVPFHSIKHLIRLDRPSHSNYLPTSIVIKFPLSELPNLHTLDTHNLVDERSDILALDD